MPALQRGAAWAEKRLLGDLWKSVPQNGRVHLLTLPALHKTFVDFFFELAWEFCIEKLRSQESTPTPWSGPFRDHGLRP